PQAFLEKNGIDGPCILFLGQHYAYKGYSQLLQAADAVWRRVPEAHFVFIGPPVGQSEREFAAKPDRRIHRLGRVDLQEKSNALAACTLLCVPSTQESFGGVYTEAWQFGKPVIGGNITAVSDVIDNGYNGYLVNQTSSDIADKIIDLLCNPEHAKVMGERGKKKLEDRYTWERLAQLTLSAYQKVL
ncbi:MAG: glycosyltransferase family 4 protein, partial [Anaerolineales bacterium]|nr:glycosyltransferase family 4 protein [Anaerolineales bacterium]